LSGSNFDDPIYLDSPIVASGPIDSHVESVLSMYVWLVQVNQSKEANDASASGEVGALSADDLARVASSRPDGKKGWTKALSTGGAGPFVAGPAFAFATALVRDDRFKSKERVIAWTESVVLEDRTAAPAATNPLDNP
jgi:hypothetical protein